MANEEALKALAGVDLFQGLEQRELEQIAGVTREVTFEAGRKIVTEGDKGVGFHLIREGTARVASGEREWGTLGAGDFFGEISLIDQGPRSATVTAETDVRTLSIASWDFMPVLDKSPTIARKLLVQLCRRLRAKESVPTH